MDISSIEKADTAKSRSSVYSLLSTLYIREVTPEILSFLKGNEISAILEGLGMDISSIVKNNPGKELLNELSEEYAALFIVPGGIKPYESVRLKGLLCQEPAWEVEEFYKKCGLIVREDSTLLPDHLGMELLFIGYLAGKEAEAWDNNDDETAAKWLDYENDFFETHINRWVLDFLRDMERLSFHPFYEGLSQLTLRFIESEKIYLNALAKGQHNL